MSDSSPGILVHHWLHCRLVGHGRHLMFTRKVCHLLTGRRDERNTDAKRSRGSSNATHPQMRVLPSNPNRRSPPPSSASPAPRLERSAPGPELSRHELSESLHCARLYRARAPGGNLCHGISLWHSIGTLASRERAPPDADGRRHRFWRTWAICSTGR